MEKSIFLSFLFAIASVNGQIINPSMDYQKQPNDPPALFLAGSASDPWREKLIQSLNVSSYVYLDPTEVQDHHSLKKIRWEHRHIELASAFVVWIPKGQKSNPKTLSLNTLFDCGRFIEMKNKPLIVGIEQGYVMRDALVKELRQLRPDIIITDSLEALSRETSQAIKKATP
ncbi:MAG: hypothetical protein HY860_06315 [Chlamydiales bacterium]|nr:hypothetical protein [Chlamydiales bacterium]